jgi:hypothetical protein
MRGKKREAKQAEVASEAQYREAVAKAIESNLPILTSNESTKSQASGNGWWATRERPCGRIRGTALVHMDGGRGLEKVWVELVGY